MLCDKCKKRTATTHIHTNIGGVSEEMNLCSYCASVMGYGSVFGGVFVLIWVYWPDLQWLCLSVRLSAQRFIRFFQE